MRVYPRHASDGLLVRLALQFAHIFRTCASAPATACIGRYGHLLAEVGTAASIGMPMLSVLMRELGSIG